MATGDHTEVKDSIHVMRLLALVLFWFLTMCQILIVALTGEDKEETLHEWRDRNHTILAADSEALQAKLHEYKGGIK